MIKAKILMLTNGLFFLVTGYATAENSSRGISDKPKLSVEDEHADDLVSLLEVLNT